MNRLAKTLPLAHWSEHGILIAVSGGADSMALLHFLAQHCPNTKHLAAAHINHRLRGEESNSDADFVRKSVADYGFRYFEHQIAQEEWNTQKSGSLEAAARNIRYDCLTRTAEQIGFRYVATAHTADDQIETILHRLTRGTGLAGLAGIAPIRQLSPAITLIRPLLDIHRNEIIAYLEKLGKPFRIDSTNSKNNFTRNRIRNLLLPMLRKEFNPKVNNAIKRLARLASENENILAELMDGIFENAIIRQTPNEIILDSAKLQPLQTSTLREFFVRLWKHNSWSLRHLGFEQWTTFVEFFRSETGRCEMRGSIIAEHDGKHFILRRDEANSEEK
ncbi:MAG: tRNA lysidine(34) synthetase TilS [Planctomycetaceae bacterium]|jgi:tRNA(Ile)-lysidine synthase|nr:tRNA lysidine(34) synthetase TilS [Planctomycetaceae bacterium]